MTFVEDRYLLSTRTNRHAPVRANGVRFWGHPTRHGGVASITCIGIHTTENEPSPATAENVARWQATTADRPSSYHVLVDSDSIVRTLEDVATAFHIVGMNTRALGLSFGTRHDRWGRYPTWDREALHRGAWVAARWCRTYSIPVRWLTKAEADRGVRGFIRHSVADPARRRDPGATFPADEFFRLVGAYLSATRPTSPSGVLTLEQFMATLTPEEQRWVQRAAAQGVADDLDGQSFVRQLGQFHREERPAVQELIRHLEGVGSSVQGLVRGSIGFIRRAREELGWDLRTDR